MTMSSRLSMKTSMYFLICSEHEFCSAIDCASRHFTSGAEAFIIWSLTLMSSFSLTFSLRASSNCFSICLNLDSYIEDWSRLWYLNSLTLSSALRNIPSTFFLSEHSNWYKFYHLLVLSEGAVDNPSTGACSTPLYVIKCPQSLSACMSVTRFMRSFVIGYFNTTFGLLC